MGSQREVVGKSHVVGSVAEKGLDQGVSASGDQKKKELVQVKEKKVLRSAHSLSLCGGGTGGNASADEKPAGRAEAVAGSS